MLLDQTGLGIAKDADALYITPAACTEQALFYAKDIFDGKYLPAYLFRYIRYMMFDDDLKKYPTNSAVLDDMQAGVLTETSPEYVEVVNFLKYVEHNPEGLQLLGLIQLIGGSLNLIRKEQAPMRLYIEYPETSLHPKRSARFMSMFHMLSKEYGFTDLDKS